ncbi:cupin domain-containing protein [Mycobacterium sp. 21AC1]|uniref:cupin domain-containing protein n=1 Tax=[Mycobacterium] appelbergii TaxID=2939269 RepID=UPI002939185F|nr:cupin domain-containing protein [Mycobacterium sp. 21AC1]MDV3126017.1 cupin domain-containing protein [Mycobacterium sp. 21AC1]
MTTIPAIAYNADPKTLELTIRGARTPALTGTPVESVHVLHSDAGGRSGIWECTPGSFDSARNGDTELMYFLTGAGTITTADGTVHEIRPGVVLVAPDGWRGTWDIRETVRKIYTIWNAAPDQR